MTQKWSTLRILCTSTLILLAIYIVAMHFCDGQMGIQYTVDKTKQSVEAELDYFREKAHHEDHIRHMKDATFEQRGLMRKEFEEIALSLQKKEHDEAHDKEGVKDNDVITPEISEILPEQYADRKKPSFS